GNLDRAVGPCDIGSVEDQTGGLSISVHQTFTVDTQSDTHDASPGDGVCADALERCSLRAAIEESNATAGGDVVVLDPSNLIATSVGPTEYPLNCAANGQLVVTRDIAIEGVPDTNGNPVIDGGGPVNGCRIF